MTIRRPAGERAGSRPGAAGEKQAAVKASGNTCTDCTGSKISDIATVQERSRACREQYKNYTPNMVDERKKEPLRVKQGRYQ